MKKLIGAAGRQALPRGLYLACCRSFDGVAAALRLPYCLGLGRQCPFCNMRWRRFLPDAGEQSELFDETQVIGGGPCEEAICPYCCSFERERHVYLYLKEMTPVFRDPTALLHIAPERNLQRVLSKQKNIRYTTGDLNPTKAQVRVDLTAIDFPDDSFDVVICNHVLEHVWQDHTAMAEILRVLRPGGWAILQVPIAPGIITRENPQVTSPEDRARLYGQYDHVRIYGRDYSDRLESTGFRVRVASLAREFGESYARRFGLLQNELIYVANKPAVAADSQPRFAAPPRSQLPVRA